MKDNNLELLEILFNNRLKFFDNDFIINLLIKYENRTPISNYELYTQINNDKYRISTKLKNLHDSSYYIDF